MRLSTEQKMEAVNNINALRAKGLTIRQACDKSKVKVPTYRWWTKNFNGKDTQTTPTPQAAKDVCTSTKDKAFASEMETLNKLNSQHDTLKHEIKSVLARLANLA